MKRYFYKAATAMLICTGVNASEIPTINEKMSREEKAKIANALREKNRRELEEAQTGFKSSTLESKNLINKSKIFTDEQICASAISALMDRPVHLIKTAKDSGVVVYASYHLWEKKKTYYYECLIEKESIRWRTAGERWRDHPLDEKITYSIKNDKVSIKMTYSDGSFSTKEISP